MSPRAKLNVVLSVALLALFVVIHLEQRGVVEGPVMVAQLDPDAVGTVHIDVRGREPVLIERGDDGWRMLEPLAIPVEPRRMRGIIDALSIASRASYPAAGMQLDELGVGDDPQASLVIDGETWRIGDRNPLEGARYIRHGDTVHLATDVLHFRLLGEPAGFAPRQLLPAGETISRIELPDATLSADGDGGWMLEPDDPGISAGARQALVDAWRNASATRVTTIDNVGAAPSRRDSVRIYFEGQKTPLGFLFHATDDDFFLVRDDLGLAYRMGPDRGPGMIDLARTP